MKFVQNVDYLNIIVLVEKMGNDIIGKIICIFFILVLLSLGGYFIFKNKNVQKAPLYPVNIIKDTVENNITITKTILSDDYTDIITILIKGKYRKETIYLEVIPFNSPDSIICKHLQAADSATKRAKYIQEEFKCL